MLRLRSSRVLSRIKSRSKIFSLKIVKKRQPNVDDDDDDDDDDFSSVLLRVYFKMDLNMQTAPGCYFVNKSDINSALMTSHFCNQSDPTPAQMLAGQGKYMIGGLVERGGWQLWESEGYELVISQDFLPNVTYAHHPFYFYRPQTSVSHSVHRRRGSASVHAGIHPAPGRHPLGRHPPRHTHPLPSACWDTPPCPLHAGIDMATAADGTHPTGMHSCLKVWFQL